MTIIFRYVLAIGTLFFATGCLHEKYDECPLEEDYNVVLNFTLLNRNNIDVFSHNISKVNLGIFDKDGICVDIRHISQNNLLQFQGAKLNLAPGTYSVVAWANVDSNDKIEGIIPFSVPVAPIVTYKTITDGIVGDADRVYYAPENEDRNRSAEMPGSYLMIVDPVLGHSGTLIFTHAYHIINVYVEGFNGEPIVGMTGLPQGLGYFGMNMLTDTDGNKLTVATLHATSIKEENNETYNFATFNTFLFGQNNDIMIYIYIKGDTVPVYQIALNEAITELCYFEEITISIIFRFNGNNVEIVVPAWNANNVNQGKN